VLFIVIALIVIVILFSARTMLSLWVDLLWFRSLGYGQVFWTTRTIGWSIFAGFTVLTFAILYGAFAALRRVHGDDLPASHTIFIAGNPIELPIAPVLRAAAAVISAIIALGTGASMQSQWPTLALYWYAPAPAGPSAVLDPIFGRPLTFYLFTLPAWQLFAGWLLTLAILLCIMAGFFLVITGGSRALTGQLRSANPLPWRGPSLALGFLLFVLSIRTYIGRLELLFEHHTIFDGVTYTDAHVSVIGMLVVAAALLLGALLAIAAGLFRPGGRWLILAVAPAIVCYLGVAVTGWYVTSFLVKPNELVREQPYIANNIELTRRAYGLDLFEQREFPAETTVGATDPANNQATLQNIRLWDVQALKDTLRQIQEIRTYYDFPTSTSTATSIDGTMREVMLGTRELNVEKLPEQPQLDQRQAHLHPRLRHHHEPGQRIHLRGPADAHSFEHARAEHRPKPQSHAPRNLLRRNDRHRCLCQNPPAGVQLP
jgi:uncharacterized membrane protein (UPF0182 family)